MIYLDIRVIYRRCQDEPMMLSESDLVGAAKTATKTGKTAGKKPALEADDTPLVTVATDKATGKMVTVPKRPTRKGAFGNLQTAK